MIRLEKVAKHYTKDGATVRALDAVSLRVKQGEFILVRGPSGSGKTTLINLSAGLARPTSGKLWVAGHALNELNEKRKSALRARHVALVFQMFHLVPYLSALDNVLLPTLAAATSGSAERAAQLLERLGLAPRANHLPAELSAGERQRCALARAVLNRPDVILADEPTGNLDEESADLVLALLAECHAQGATVLLASHQHIEKIPAGREFHLEKGQLV